MTVRNPFRPTRFEHHQHPLIWISPDVRRLEGLKSVYVAGTRGSGKTSLLKAVNWRERLYNTTVKDQLGDAAPDYVAVYFRLPDYLTGAVGLIDWATAFPKSPSPTTIAFEVFTQLIEYAAAQLICEAIASLRASMRFKYTFNEESAVVKNLIDKNPILTEVTNGNCFGLDDLSQVFRSLHQKLNVLITRGQVDVALDYVMQAQPGFFINDLATTLRSLACSEEGICSPDFHIKICIDDCETLKQPQQQYLNTLVRSSKHPLFWIVSYVSGDYDSTNTVHHGQTLSDADRSQIHLDDLDHNVFYKLCENVSRLRVHYSSQEMKAQDNANSLQQEFSLRNALSNLHINDFLLSASEGSLSADFAKLVERSRANSLRWKASKKVPPIYETYVEEKLGERLRDDRPDNLNAYMRRKQVAALLAICSEYKISKPPLVGAAVIASMSDGCIRDYLEIMGSVFDEAVARHELKKVSDLGRRSAPISLDTQREGVRKSSRAKFDGIRNSLEQDGAEATRAIEFLGKLTSRLQTNHASLLTLSTPERGNFIFDVSTLNESRAPVGQRRAFVLRLLRRCEADGLLRPGGGTGTQDDSDSGELTFHVHRRFAAFFGFSYRGPYGTTRMPMEDFADACHSDPELSIDECVDSAYAKIQREQDAFQHPRLL